MKIKQPYKPIIFACVAVFYFQPALLAQKGGKPAPLVVNGKGVISYTPDSLGNRIPDFSYAGYKGNNTAIPDVPVKIFVPAKDGDATLRIQSAIDYVASLPADANGIRGAVLLGSGMFTLNSSLLIKTSGIVLRGSGINNKGTQLIAATTSRETVIRIAGKADCSKGKSYTISDAYAPVNSLTLHVLQGSFKAGDNVFIRRPCTKEWIQQLGTETFGGGVSALGWKPGERDLIWDRKIISVAGSAITLDAPLTTALDMAYGGGTVSAYAWPGRISNCGVENLSIISTYDEKNGKDEAHRWMGITIENAEDCWVRQASFENLAGSAVAVLESTNRITVEDCLSFHPVSEIGGQRRNTFFTSGGQTLFQRIYSENGFHDFATGFCTPGPAAFVQCQSKGSLSFSGAIDSWSSGVLFDIVNIDGNALKYANREQDGQGAGWAAANSLFWQCTAARVENYKPPGADNWAFGTWAQFAGNGYWESSNEQIHPRSLFYAQLANRLGDAVIAKGFVMPVETEASSSPPVEVAMKLTAQAVNPAPLLLDWIRAASKRQPIPVNNSGVKTIDQIGITPKPAATTASAMRVVDGRLVRGNILITGKRQEVPWWTGGVLPADLPKMKWAITRYVPGRTGTGLTDDLNELTDSMKAGNWIGLEQNYALWYDRRRDDHERIRRMDGDVWPPFYELPFARSGRDTAWDGLSKYDLTKYNTWYWSRLKKFADLADQKGLVLVHQNYFQHNIIEAGAHYADFPWRPVNNVNHTGFPEPPPYAGDKRIFMAEQFYDTTDAIRRPLHKAFIKQCLNNFRDNNGVIQLIGAEFTGPLHFTQFWLNTIKEWEAETGKKELIGLSTTKDVQDAVLADPKYASVVNVIDIRQWHYQADGKTYEPKGGQNLAPRQHARLLKPKATSFEQVYRAVSEYRQKYPDKAVVYSGDSYDTFGWAVLMAGGSLPSVPAITDTKFLEDAAGMKPFALTDGKKGQWALSTEGKGLIVYTASAEPVQLNLTGWKSNYSVRWINTRSGQTTGKEENVMGGKIITLQPPQNNVILWLSKM